MKCFPGTETHFVGNTMTNVNRDECTQRGPRVCVLRVRASCAKTAELIEMPFGKEADSWHRTSRSHFCRILYGLYLPTVILTIIWWPPTHSFTPGLKPSFSANPSHCRPSFLLLKYSSHGFPGLFTVISDHICFLLLVFLFLHFLVVGCVRY